MAGSSLWKGIHTAPERAYRTLRVVPLIGRSSTEPVYRLYDGESAGDVEITEVSEGGSVPDIRVKNRGRRLLLIDGQELLGAKQNRILNTDVLVAADADVVIPVSCVEAGRWGYRGKLFSPGKMMYSSGRASKSESVARSLRMGAGPNADQGEVWKKINQLLRKLRVSSDSSEMHAAYAQRDEDLQEIRAALELPEDTVGVAVYDGDRLLGLDLFDRAPTLARHWKSLVDSYAIEWLAVSEAGQAPEAGSESGPPVEELLSTLSQGQWERFDAPGEGSDMRWQDDRLTASALVWGDDNIVHLQAFPRQHETTAQ